MKNQKIRTLIFYYYPIIILRWTFLFIYLPSLSQSHPPAHAHNDYAKKHPLFDAIGINIRSVEVDLFLKNDQLIVSHVPLALGMKPTFQNLYLNPLATLIQQNGGTVWPGDSTPLTLYLDFKTGEGTLEKVKETLLPYWDLLQLQDSISTIWGPIQILIDHHEKELAADYPRWAQTQKHWDQASIPLSPDLCPRLSGHYGSIFDWRGKGPIPEAEFAKMKAIADSAHAHGRTVRLYAVPANEAVWQAMLAAGMDWINVDDYQKFRLFWERWKAEQTAAKPQRTQ